MLLSILLVLTSLALLAVCYVLYKAVTVHVIVLNVKKVTRRSRDYRLICPECLCKHSSQKVTITRLFVKAIFSTLKVILQAEGRLSQDIHSWILGPAVPDPIERELTPCQLVLAQTRAALAKLFMVLATICLPLQEALIMKCQSLLLSMTELPQELCCPHQL